MTKYEKWQFWIYLIWGGLLLAGASVVKQAHSLTVCNAFSAGVLITLAIVIQTEAHFRTKYPL